MSKLSISLSVCAIVISAVALLRPPPRAFKSDSNGTAGHSNRTNFDQTKSANTPDQITSKKTTALELVNTNAQLRAEIDALRKDLQSLKAERQAQGTMSNRPVQEAPTIDHNQEIPGLQTEDEVKGIPVLGDPTNTIHPETPPDEFEAELEIKRKASRLLAQSRDAEEQGQPESDKAVEPESP